MRSGGNAVLALVGAMALLSAACGSDAPAAEGSKRAVVAVLIPGGDDASAAFGEVPTAVGSALADVEVPGWAIDVVTIDSRSARVDDIVGDDVVAVVGGFNGDARRHAPEFADASLLFVAPDDDDRMHTRGADPMTSVRPYATYYTMAQNRGDPLALLAYYATQGRGLTSLAVIDVGGGELTGERRQFADHVRVDKADVVVSERVDNIDKAGDSAIQQAAKGAADGLFVTGGRRRAAAFIERARSAGLDVPLFVSPSLADDELLALVGEGVENAVSVRHASRKQSTSPSVPGMPKPGPRAASSYDTGTALGVVFERCLPAASSADDARAGCAGEMREAAFDGVTGDVAFNDFGERTGSSAEFVVAKAGSWTLKD